MNSQQLEVTQEKDLGIIISNDLKVSQQCQAAAASKATRILGIINRSIVFKHSDILIRLYKLLVRPHLEYCTVAVSYTHLTLPTIYSV